MLICVSWGLQHVVYGVYGCGRVNNMQATSRSVFVCYCLLLMPLISPILFSRRCSRDALVHSPAGLQGSCVAFTLAERVVLQMLLYCNWFQHAVYTSVVAGGNVLPQH
jgi:hypothetical protein